MRQIIKTLKISAGTAFISLDNGYSYNIDSTVERYYGNAAGDGHSGYNYSRHYGDINGDGIGSGSSFFPFHGNHWGGLPLIDPKIESTMQNDILRSWQQKGLLPLDDQKRILVWKCVDKNMVGHLRYKYVIGERYNCVNAMTTAGPLGALTDWRKAPEPHVIAIWAERIIPSDKHIDGVFYAPEGTPVALYRAENLDKTGFDPVLVAGVDVIGLLI